MFKSSIFALTMGGIIIIGNTQTVLAEVYKTLTNQVIVTNLSPKTKYKVNTFSFKDREGIRTITTNACGEGAIINGTGYKKLIIEGNNIVPSTLALKERPRCNVKKK
ncbi:MAG TPA: hypothetical protein V6C58_24045 [Allocoleopsis sp.]